jgi:serine protease Do
MRRGIVVGLGIAAVATVALVASPRVQGASEEKERVKRIEVIRHGGGGRLGVELEEVDKDDVARLKLGEERGAVVRRVDDGSPAAKAGIQKDDVIVKFQGEDVRSASQLARIVRETPAGRTVGIEVSRGGATQRLTATLAEGSARVHFGDFDVPMPVPPEPPEAPEPPALPRIERRGDRGGSGFSFRDFTWGSPGPRRLGIEFDEVSGQFAKFLQAPGDHAVVVTSVDDGSAAAKAGLKAGDVIVRFAGREIREARDLREEVRRAEGGKELTVAVQRDGKPVDLKVTLAPLSERRRGSDETT